MPLSMLHQVNLAFIYKLQSESSAFEYNESKRFSNLINKDVMENTFCFVFIYKLVIILVPANVIINVAVF